MLGDIFPLLYMETPGTAIFLSCIFLVAMNLPKNNSNFLYPCLDLETILFYEFESSTESIFMQW